LHGLATGFNLHDLATGFNLHGQKIYRSFSSI